MANVRLTITVVAERDGDDLPGAADAIVSKSIELIMPYIDPKFVTVPKVVDGVMLDVLTEHGEKIAAVKARAEARRMTTPGALWMGATVAAEGD